jgi:hypothetical protein
MDRPPFEPDGLTQAQLLDAIGISNNAWGDARLWGAIYSHRQACVRYLRDYVLWKLEDPSTTRSSLKRLVIAQAKRVEEWGPPTD